MFRFNRLPGHQVICTILASLCFLAQAQAEQFVTAPARETGPFISGQTTPAPGGGGWQAGDDRTLNASINGQGGWQTVTFSSRYDEEIATGIAHTGGHSWRLSNWFHTGLVNPILSPAFTPVGEAAASNHVVYEFWFRSASVQPDPGSFISTTISDAPGNRMTYLGFFDEIPGPGTGGPSGNGCPDDNGCFHLDAVEVTSGDDAAGDGDATFVDHYSPPLTRGVWYRARIDATFVAGPGPQTADPDLCPLFAPSNDCHTGNDQIHYQIFDVNGHVVFDTGAIGSWEAAYYDGRYGNPVGTLVAMDHVAFRVSANADDGTQQPFDTNSVTNRPHGDYFDDMSVTPDVGTGFTTSFDFDRYVATTGNDAGNCTDANNPCQTITYAMTQSNDYDSIHAAAGIYAENTTPGDNLTIGKPVAIEGAQVGMDARTRNVGDGNETILVPALQDLGLTLGSLGDVAVVQINSSGVSLDGLIIDGDNPGITSPVTLNGTNPDADSGIFAAGSGITVQNVTIRNVGGAGVLAQNDSAGGDNAFQHDRFTNITNPSTWGIGIYAGYNFYAQICDNLMDQVRVGIQTENNSAANPGTQAPVVQRNEIHTSRTGLFHNLFYQSASTYTLADNVIDASVNAAQVGQWNGIQIESMQSDQTVIVEGNIVDGSALAGSGRPRAGYVLNNWTSSQAATTAIDGGSVSNVDAGVLVTDATNYTGPVNGALIQGITFNNIAIGAIYVEDTNEVDGAPSVTIGAGNNFSGVAHQLALAGVAPNVGFSGISGVDSVLVRVAGNYLFGRLNGGPCNVTECTVSNASINAGIAAANAGGTVFIEQGTFDETATIGKNGLRLTAADANNPPTLTRLSGGPNQPVLVVNGAADVDIDHLDFTVDKTFAGEGVLANGAVDGLSIHDNQFTQTWSNTAVKASYKFTNAVSINIDGQHNSLGLGQTYGSNVTIQDNVITGSATPNPTQFRAGIAMDASVGTISGNTSTALNHDAIVRFATTVPGGSNGVAISGNQFLGGGLEFDAPNAGITPITITGNTITANPVFASAAPDQTALEADISVMRLIDNPQGLAVTVSGNTFSGYANGYRGALVENFPNATFEGNSFTPLAGAADFVSLVVSNKEINTDNPPEKPYPMTFTALSNTFNGSGMAGAGRAVEFINDNDANGTASFGAITFGDNTAANANIFDANHGRYFNLVDQNCDTRVPPGNAPQCTFLDYNDVGSVANTQVRPFRGNVYAVNNRFGGVMPGAMSPQQQAALNAQTFDINDDSALGYVDYGLYHVVIGINGPVANVQATVPTAYSAELTNTGSALTENVLVQFVVARTGGIAPGDLSLQYFDGSQYQPITLSACGIWLCGTFGPPTGFAMPAGYDATTALQATFAVADTFTVQAFVQGVTSNVIYATDTHTTQVVQTPTGISLNLMGPQTGLVAGAATTGYSAQISNTGGATTENVLVDFTLSRTGGLGAGDITLEYWTGSVYAAIPLSTCGTSLCGSFGPPGTGFPIGVGYNATTALRFTSLRTGTITVGASVDGVTTHGSYASSMLSVQVSAAAAANIAANSATSFAGTAGTGATPLPSVLVTDSFGNPVSGYTVNFVTGSSSGTLSGATRTTDVNGIATVGGWTLGTAASETVTVTAALAGSPVTFTATVTAQFDLAISVTDNRDYVQYGHTLDYAIVVSNAGPSTATNTVTDNLPPELDPTGASWVCLAHTAGAVCTAKGSGNLSDTPTIPSGGSVTYVLSTTVPSVVDGEVIDNQVSVGMAGDANTANNTATSHTQVVIFRDGFESGGDGAQ
jgi:uncharacterized repeat protein (TIGR01451 family)